MTSTILARRLKSTSPLSFGMAFGHARASSDQVAAATSPFTHVPGTRYFLATNGRSGCAIRPDGELVLVFSLDRGQGDAIVAHAVAQGATHLDCFDGYLVTLYSRHGFERVTSLPNWTPGGPDVVYMATPGNLLAALDKAEGNAPGIAATHL